MLYVMRHGETQWNTQGRLQGCTDIPLNETGRRMAAGARDTQRNMHIDVCYTSPLKRARETAEIFLDGSQVPVICDHRLREMGFGRYEGVIDAFHTKEPPFVDLFHHPSAYVPETSGESFAELFQRTGAFLEDTAMPLVKEGKDVLVVGHGAMLASMICRVRDIPLDNFWEHIIDNCKVVRLL